jgi:hypothetical protein
MPGQEMRMSGADWPKASQMPRCTMCFDLMTAPESSVLMSMASSAISGAATPAAKRWLHTASANLAIQRLTRATLIAARSSASPDCGCCLEAFRPVAAPRALCTKRKSVGHRRLDTGGEFDQLKLGARHRATDRYLNLSESRSRQTRHTAPVRASPSRHAIGRWRLHAAAVQLGGLLTREHSARGAEHEELGEAGRQGTRGRPEDTERNAAIGRMLASCASWGTIQSATGCSRATIAKMAKRGA